MKYVPLALPEWMYEDLEKEAKELGVNNYDIASCVRLIIDEYFTKKMDEN